ncbi:hypothetical protein I203_100174 [Kwoniella mangroviensis CBS 8507]|uniref:uncharacterized protein n=1 Tax=Kwoniella mangroviensis CBS 8507 TaxID=1296122 RepID=UPI00080D1D48|nr:uncharacterized protein I203_08079 [Kwoniella mangroviensis CBS 8507]OCF62855.1 hypothetical protein I203_08079 [Kwoniella mangroviensis CBS 8507]
MSGTWDDQWSIEIGGDGQTTEITGYLEPDPQIVEKVRLLHQQLWLKMWLNQCDYYMLYNTSSILIYHLKSPTQIRLSYVAPLEEASCPDPISVERVTCPDSIRVYSSERWQSPVTPSAAPRTNPKDRATSIGIALQKMRSILDQDGKRLGRTWDVYLAVLAISLRLTQNKDDIKGMLGPKGIHEGSANPYVILRVVAKITPTNLPECLRLVEKRSQTEAMKAARNESKIYNTRLLKFQGDKVPECYGLWKVNSGPNKRLIMVLSRVEGRLEREDENWEHLHDLDRIEIAKLYQAIHSVGVVHGDKSLRHIRYDYSYPSTDPYRDPSPLMLIDFEGSKIVGKRHPDLSKEKSIVLSKLDLAEDYY